MNTVKMAGNLLVFTETNRSFLQLQASYMDEMVDIEIARLNVDVGAAGSEARHKRSSPRVADMGIQEEDYVVAINRLFRREAAMSSGIEFERTAEKS